MTALELSCQENLLPGRTVLDKWRFAADAGYSAVELRGRADGDLLRRLPELHRAVAQGAVFRTVCVDMPYFPGAFDAADRARSVREINDQLTAIADLGGVGVVTPAAFGLFSAVLPPYQPPIPAEVDRRQLLEALQQICSHAAALGVKVLLEPLNRYENHQISTLAQAAEVIAQLPAGSVGITADSFHMNIEEVSIPAALSDAAPLLRHVQISDSNRAIPGFGHFDWADFLDALDAAGYSGDVAVECLTAPVDHDARIAAVPAYLRRIRGKG
jgi:sugar phosphate isomerase/epimerase